MDENEIRAAIAEQEEYLKRVRSCQDVLGTAHAFRPHGRPGTKQAFSACVVCSVTETRDDYAAKNGT